MKRLCRRRCFGQFDKGMVWRSASAGRFFNSICDNTDKNTVESSRTFCYNKRINYGEITNCGGDSLKISRLIIKNYRNLRNIDIHLSNTVALIGENNSGKSNLLRAV